MTELDDYDPAAYDALAALSPLNGTVAVRLNDPVDWDALFARTPPDQEWIVDDWWPAGRHLHVHASRKVGKSLLALWVAVSVARGRDPFTDRPIPSRRVSYFDMEMSEDDLHDRLADMEVTAAELRLLSYYLLPAMPPLDSEPGGRALLAHLDRDGSDVVVIDTVARAVSGDENEADTYRRLWAHTGLRLKSSGRSSLRLDHEGHQAGRSRGSSAKADDVDLVYGMTAGDDGALRLDRKYARVRGTDDRIDLARVDDPLRFRRVSESWPAGTAELAAALDDAGVPLDAGRRPARAMLRAAGLPSGRGEVLAKALAWRRRKVDTGLR